MFWFFDSVFISFKNFSLVTDCFERMIFHMSAILYNENCELNKKFIDIQSMEDKKWLKDTNLKFTIWKTIYKENYEKNTELYNKQDNKQDKLQNEPPHFIPRIPDVNSKAPCNDALLISPCLEYLSKVLSTKYFNININRTLTLNDFFIAIKGKSITVIHAYCQKAFYVSRLLKLAEEQKKLTDKELKCIHVIVDRSYSSWFMAIVSILTLDIIFVTSEKKGPFFFGQHYIKKVDLGKFNFLLYVADAVIFCVHLALLIPILLIVSLIYLPLKPFMSNLDALHKHDKKYPGNVTFFKTQEFGYARSTNKENPVITLNALVGSVINHNSNSERCENIITTIASKLTKPPGLQS